MVEKIVEQVSYKTELINKVTCDYCNKDITNDNFFTLNVSYSFLPDGKSTYINKMFNDEESCHLIICEDCAKEKLTKICEPVKEYIEDNIGY